ncbi:hypothetical protein HZS_380 [Henneguya salminicola]|nr:hypothetical protein HZS_380 [Henneguya salminicola]
MGEELIHVGIYLSSGIFSRNNPMILWAIFWHTLREICSPYVNGFFDQINKILGLKMNHQVNMNLNVKIKKNID